ncbi:S28 family serine protease [Lutibacter holmesii]|uniref:S28 family serine protease n=1 Tax=Lutibacter holmesii TaxID=1137985 RepID=A0ABW3WQ57_9FLAO
MKLYRSIFFIVALSLSVVSCKTIQLEPVEILTFKQQLEQLFPDAEITKMEAKDHFTKAYQLVLNEPLDHKNPEAGTFKHYVYLSHVDEELPVVLVTEGYNARPQTYEMSKILKGNQVQVEYRFYGKSRPDSIPWQYLTNDQAVEDYHQLVTKLRRLYTGKWVSTGISKGGETVLIYKSKYPWDVRVAVPYVAPLIQGQEDPRTEAHIKTIGSDACRTKIEKYQRLILENRDAVLAEISSYATLKNMSFTEVSIEEALEYAVLEFPFSFWQWGGKCEDIPTKSASAKELFDYVNSIVGIGFYNDKTYEDLLPSYYQHMTELGYYGFDTTPVKDLIKVVHKPTNLRFAPKNMEVAYSPEFINEVRDFAENKGKQILYIYGEYDTWGACAPSPKPHVDALKMVLKEGSHKTRIEDFSKEDQQLIYDKLQKWMGYSTTIYPLED